MDHSQSILEPQITANPYRINMSKTQVLKVFKWILIVFNAVLIITILGGLCVYFSEIREKSDIKLGTAEDTTFSNELVPKSSGSSGPKYAWLVSMFAYALLLVIPCIGFVGAIKENVCLLILYAIIFSVEAVIILLFRSFWFLFPALIASATVGLVIVIRSDAVRGEKERKSMSRSRINWCLDKV